MRRRLVRPPPMTVVDDGSLGICVALTFGDPSDTSNEAGAIQFERWRSMTSTEKLRLVEDLCRDIDALARLGIERDHPSASEHEVLHLLAARRYGTDLADAAYGSPPTR